MDCGLLGICPNSKPASSVGKGKFEKPEGTWMGPWDKANASAWAIT